jgi:hypothetical protein
VPHGGPAAAAAEAEAEAALGRAVVGEQASAEVHGDGLTGSDITSKVRQNKIKIKEIIEYST